MLNELLLKGCMMEISIKVSSDEISVGELFDAQTKSEALGGGFDVEYLDCEAVIKWNFTPKDPVAFLGLVDELQREHSCDVLDNCILVDIDTIAYHQSVDMYSIGDCLHIPNSLD